MAAVTALGVQARFVHDLGRAFGAPADDDHNLFVGLQPAFGYEGDPMRLLFERSFAPTHAFSGFYRWIREDFRAHAVLHFGTHGALEFMPGKQAGLSGDCWPDRLVAAIAERTDGVPLFIEESTKAVLDAGLIEDFAQEPQGLHLLASPAVPASLRDSLVARLDRRLPS